MDGMRKFVTLMVAVMTMASAGMAQKSRSGGEAAVHKAAAVPAVTNPTLTPVDDAGWLPGYLPVFDANGNLEDSFLFQSGTAANPQLALGTTTPIYNLQFIATVNPASVDIDGYGNVMGINFLGRRAEGTLANPMQVLTDDNLMAMGAFGWFQSGTTGVKSGFSPYTRASMKFFASQPWTDTAQGTYISLATTPNNTAPNASAASTTERMRIDDLGNVGIGTTTPTGAASTTTPVTLEVNGTVKLTKSSGGGIIFQDGTALNSAVNLPSTAAGNTFNGSQTINGFETVVDSIYSDGSVYVDASHNNSGGSVVPGLNFGGFGTGEGIASNRNSGVNVYGLDFYTNRTRQMSITNSGQVGIGTATPGAQLEVDSAGANAVIVGDAFGKSSTGSGFTGAISGVWGDDGDKTYTGGTGVLGTSDVNFAGYFINNNTTYIPAIWAEDDESTNAKQVVFETIGGHYGGGCEIDVSGNLVCTGAVTAAVAVASGAKQVAVYGVQSAENWLEDAGGGQLSNGAARVEFEPTFAQTVNGAAEYRVFLTPNGDCNGLYVSAKTATGFEVHELGGGKSSIAFDYRIMAKRTGYENVRLEDLTEQFKRQKAVRGMAPHPAAVSTAEAR